MKWPYYRKDVNQINLNFIQIFVEFSWMWIFTWIKLSWHSCCVGRTGMTQLILAISLWGVLPLIEKDFDTCMVLLFMWRMHFLLHLSLENSADFYLCLWLALLCFWLALPSAVFVFRDFNIHHKDWSIYSDGTVDLVNSIYLKWPYSDG